MISHQRGHPACVRVHACAQLGGGGDLGGEVPRLSQCERVRGEALLHAVCRGSFEKGGGGCCCCCCIPLVVVGKQHLDNLQKRNFLLEICRGLKMLCVPTCTASHARKTTTSEVGHDLLEYFFYPLREFVLMTDTTGRTASLPLKGRSSSSRGTGEIHGATGAKVLQGQTKPK